MSVRIYVISIILKNFIILLKMDYDLVAKMHVNELKNYLKVRGLKISGNRTELVDRVFSAKENNVMPVKTAVEVEEDLKKEYKKKLRGDGRVISDRFKTPHGWSEKDEGMAFWPILLFPDISNYSMFYPTQLGSTDLSDYKNSKPYSYYKSGWFQPLYFHKLPGSKCCIFKGECRHSQRINEINHKLWIIMEKSGKI